MVIKTRVSRLRRRDHVEAVAVVLRLICLRNHLEIDKVASFGERRQKRTKKKQNFDLQFLDEVLRE